MATLDIPSKCSTAPRNTSEGSRANEDDNGINIAVSNKEMEQTSEESLFDTNSTLTTASGVTSDDNNDIDEVLENTVIEAHLDGLSNYKEKYEECKRILDERTEDFKKTITKYGKMLDGTAQATRMHLNRNTDEIFKSKSRRRIGSTTNVVENKCQYGGCEAEDMDLVKCSICSRYVCEFCNEVPFSKLKRF